MVHAIVHIHTLNNDSQFKNWQTLNTKTPVSGTLSQIIYWRLVIATDSTATMYIQSPQGPSPSPPKTNRNPRWMISPKNNQKPICRYGHRQTLRTTGIKTNRGRRLSLTQLRCSRELCLTITITMTSSDAFLLLLLLLLPGDPPGAALPQCIMALHQNIALVLQ